MSDLRWAAAQVCRAHRSGSGTARQPDSSCQQGRSRAAALGQHASGHRHVHHAHPQPAPDHILSDAPAAVADHLRLPLLQPLRRVAGRTHACPSLCGGWALPGQGPATVAALVPWFRRRCGPACGTGLRRGCRTHQEVLRQQPVEQHRRRHKRRLAERCTGAAAAAGGGACSPLHAAGHSCASLDAPGVHARQHHQLAAHAQRHIWDVLPAGQVLLVGAQHLVQGG